MKTPIALLLLFLACWSSGVAVADEAQWRANLAAGKSAYYAGDHNQALTRLRIALEEADSFGRDDPRYLDTLDYLAGVYFADGRLQEAARLYRQALEILSRLHDRDHPDLRAVIAKLESVRVQLAEQGAGILAPVRQEPAGSGDEPSEPFAGGVSRQLQRGWYANPEDDSPATLQTGGDSPGGVNPPAGADAVPTAPQAAPDNGAADPIYQNPAAEPQTALPPMLWWSLGMALIVAVPWIMVRRMAAKARQLDTLTLEANQLLERSPAIYKLRVVLLAALGYVYLAGLMLLALGCLAVFGYSLTFGVGAAVVLLKLNIVLPLLILVGVILRAMWVRLPPPGGLGIRRADFPELFAMLDSVRHRIRGPRIHQVQITGDYNAALCQIPRLGVLGWQKNYLILGLPLLLTLSTQQLKSVVAHEFGHLSGAHSRIGAWIYRVRQTWFQLLQAFDQAQHWGKGLVQRFLNWYAPYFNAYSFALARANEYQADAVAAEVTSPGNTASALIATTVMSRHLEEDYWSPIYDRALNESEPPVDAYSSLRNRSREPLDPLKARIWLDQAMAMETTGDDTHPCLRDRLEALGENARMPELISRSAAEDLLGIQLAPLLAQFDAWWCGDMAQGWHERHEQLKEAAARLATLEETFDPQSTESEVLWERACLIELLRGAQAALPEYRALLAVDSNHGGVNFALGRILLQDEDREGIALLKEAMDLDIEAVIPGCEILCRYYAEHGEQAAVRKYRDRAREHQRQLDAAAEERQNLTVKDKFEEHGLDPRAIYEIASQLSKIAFVKRAWLVRKKVRKFPQHPCYVLFFERKQRVAMITSSGNLAQQLAESVQFPGDTLVVESVDQARKPGRRAASVAGSAIY